MFTGNYDSQDEQDPVNFPGDGNSTEEDADVDTSLFKYKEVKSQPKQRGRKGMRAQSFWSCLELFRNNELLSQSSLTEKFFLTHQVGARLGITSQFFFSFTFFHGQTGLDFFFFFIS